MKQKYAVKQARDSWEKNKDAEEALDFIQNVNCLEKYLLRGLCLCSGNDLLGAFNFVSLKINSIKSIEIGLLM